MKEVKCLHCGSAVECPMCGNPIKGKEAIEDLLLNAEFNYCSQCGKEIASTLKQALTMLEDD